jgi:hypothetical protein
MALQQDAKRDALMFHDQLAAIRTSELEVRQVRSATPAAANQQANLNGI